MNRLKARLIKTFEFTPDNLADNLSIDEVINTWIQEEKVLVISSSQHRTNERVIVQVVYESLYQTEKVTLSDFLENNSGIFTVIGVLVAMVVFSFSIGKNASYITAALIGLFLLILYDFHVYRGPSRPMTGSLRWFIFYTRTFSVYLCLYWLIYFRSQLKTYDYLWAIFTWGIIFDICTKRFGWRRMDDSWIKYAILFNSFWFGVLILTKLFTFGLDNLHTWAMASSLVIPFNVK